MSTYLAGLGMAEVGNSNELVRFNEDHSAKELPQGAAQSTVLWLKQTSSSTGYSNQELLVGAANTRMSRDVQNKFLTHARLIGCERGVDTTLKKWNPDVNIAPADSAYNL